MILDLFAGPGGWSEGLRMLGRSDVGIEMDRDACLTRAAAGHATIRGDVQRMPLRLGELEGLIASPPCTDFSVAGKMAGRTGETGELIDIVLPLVAAWQPRWVACEQVPPCLPIWQEHAAYYRSLGYRTWVGVLNAADYGVPQTRKRAFLLASLDVQPRQPTPTHARRPGMLGELPWVPMADALGWGMSERPGFTFCGANGGGPDLAGGSGARAALKRAPWSVDRRTVSRGAGGTRVPTVTVPMDRPSPTLVQAEKWVLSRPATTVMRDARIGRPGHKNRDTGESQFGPGSVRLTVQDALILQSFPPDYPVQGSRSSQFRQVGNAVPPLLAARVLEQFIR